MTELGQRNAHVPRRVVFGTESRVWEVLHGALDVFARCPDGEGAEQPNFPLFRVHAGEIVANFEGVAGSDLPYLVLIPSAGTKVMRCDLRLDDPDRLAQLDLWLHRLLEAGPLRPLPQGAVSVMPKMHMVGEREVPHCSAHGLLWLESEVPFLMSGDDHATCGSVVAVTRRVAARLGTRGRLWGRTSRELFEAEQLEPALRNCQAMALRAIRRAMEEDKTGNTRRLQAREAAASRLLGVAQREIREVFGKRPPQGRVEGSGEHSFVACVRLVAEHAGLSLNGPEPFEAGDMAIDTMASAIAAASGLRIRRVDLPENWWREDNGSFIGFMGQDRPVAVLRKRGRYFLFDETGTVVERAGRSVFGSLSKRAYVLYRPLPAEPISARGLLRFALRGRLGEMWVISLAAGITGILGVLTPIVTGIIFSDVVPHSERGQLAQIMSVLGGVAIGTLGLKIAQSVTTTRLQGMMDASTQAAVWDRVISLPVSFFSNREVGDLATRVLGINTIYTQLTSATLNALLGGVFSLVNLGLMLYYSWKLSLLGVAAVLLLFAVSFTFAAFNRQLGRLQMDRQGILSSRTFQYVTGIAKLRTAGAETFAFANWLSLFAKQMDVTKRARILTNLQGILSIGLSEATSMGIFFLLAYFVTGVSVGRYLAFNASFGQFYSGMAAMAGAVISTMSLIPLYERAQPILLSAPEDSHARARNVTLGGAFELSHISFSYHPDQPLILRDLSLAVRPGEFVAIVGSSGSGKSTLLRLLLGFEQPAQGRVSFDGIDLDTLNLRRMRQQIGVVLQNGKLQPGSIFDNIAANRPLTLDEAWRAAGIANISDDIRAMPMGMHTLVSENSSTFSGGQKQRMMIARAVAGQPRLLLFDEATSALDHPSQALITQALSLMPVTRVVVAHRLSTIRDADRIIVMDAGRIVEEGSFQSLIAKGEHFARLAERQIA